MKKQLADLLSIDVVNAIFRTRLFSNACFGPTVFSFNKADELICSNPLLAPIMEGLPENLSQQSSVEPVTQYEVMLSKIF